MNGLPEWMAVGQPVVVYTPSAYGRGGSLKFTKVARVLKRDLVCENDERFAISSLTDAGLPDRSRQSLIRRSGTWSSSTFLIEPSDPRVEQTRKANRVERAHNEVYTAYEAYRRASNNAKKVDIAAAVDALVEAATALQQALADAQE